MALIEQSDALPVVAAVPITNAPSATSPPKYAEWGTATRILRLVKPPVRNPRQPFLVSLHGLTRVHLTSPFAPVADGPVLPVHEIEYPPTERIPTHDIVEKFKSASLRLLDRLAKDAVQSSRKEGFIKISNMLDDITDARAPWMADVLSGTINGDYDDKLGTQNVKVSFISF